MRGRRRKTALATRAALALGGAIAVLSPAAGARAEDAGHVHATLDYALPDGASSCPDRDAFVSSIATRLGYDPFAGPAPPDGAAPRTLIVRFRREKSAITALLRIGDTEKSLVSESGACDELGSAAAFAAAILLDPRVMFPRPAPPPGGAGSLNSNAPGTWPWYEPPPTLPPPEAPRRPVAPTPTLKLRAGIAATGCAGCGPAPNVGATVFFGVARERLGLDVGARADLATSAQADGGGPEISASLVVGELFPHFRLGPARLGVLGQMGALFGDSQGVKQTSLWGGAGARAGLAFPLFGPVFLHAALDGVVVIGRVSLRVAGREVWSSPGFVGGLGLGGGVEF